jgi:hypothetical protein
MVLDFLLMEYNLVKNSFFSQQYINTKQYYQMKTSIKIVLILLPILFSCGTPCPSQADLTPYYCDQCTQGFADCIKKNFPAGSSYVELSNYMEKIGFIKIKPNYLKKGVFVFDWSANNLANTKLIVSGQYNGKLQILEINAP